MRGELSRKPVRSLNTKELKTPQQQVTDQGSVKYTDSVDNAHVENDSSENPLKQSNQENLPVILPDSKKKPHSELPTINKSKTNCFNATKSNVTTKQTLGKGPVNRTVLKDRVNKQFVKETRVVFPPVKSQQLSKGTNLARTREKKQKPVPSHFVQIVGRTQVSENTGVKNIKYNGKKYERPNKTKLTSSALSEQKVKNTKSRTHPSLPQEGYSSRYSNIKQDQKSTQPCFKRRASCVLQKSKALNSRPHLADDKISSVIPSIPNIKANGTNRNNCNNNCQQKAQTEGSKFKKTLPQNHLLIKTAPKTQAGVTVSSKKVPNGTQTNPNMEKKPEAGDRRKQLEEWRKSKGKTYKRPPMELQRKKKIIEQMNISFWKSMEQEEEEKKEQLELFNKINSTLTECLQLIEGGGFYNEILSILTSIPEAEKFTKFWICKAKLLASRGTFDVIGLYEEAIKSGATPIEELREFVFNILQDPNRTKEGITAESLVAETNITSTGELADQMEPAKLSQEVIATPQINWAKENNLPGIKLQIASIPRKKGMPEVQDMKLITPVRRSERIERVVSRYPEMLQEHGLVVTSLNELLDVEETDCYIFRKNEALPVTLGFQTLES